ncbi:MAG TPA: hypothetical protein VGU27_01210 [Candidatus Eisenbacteria bacterium]|nr:hypothetical protein [Candidatus Eisenbacteria bacterium]
MSALRPRLAALALAALAAAAAAGCGLKGTLRPDTPPTTVVFVKGPVDTVNHIVHLFWFGSDVDGTIAGFEWRLLNPAAPADTGWHFTPRTDSVFTIFTPAGYTMPTFVVRAIDNAGLRDPNPARETFQFRNLPPIVKLTLKPGASDTTFASVTVTWSINDPDGDPSKAVYRVWLDGRAATPEITNATTFTMPSDRFFQAGGSPYFSGYRTLFVQAIDDGGMAGPPDSVRWFVRQPVAGTRARLLIVDDVPRTNPSNFQLDTLYTHAAARYLPPDQYSILRLEFTQPFKSALDLQQTLQLFETVVWYRENEISLSSVLQNDQAGLVAYLQGGGRLFLDGLYLFSGQQANGSLTGDFARQVLDCEGFLEGFTFTTTFTDSTIGYGNVNGSAFFSDALADSLHLQQMQVRSGEAGGFRAFHVKNASDVLMVAAPGAITPASTDSLAVAVSVSEPGGGRAVVACMPIGVATPRNASPAARVLARIYAILGLAGP